MRGSPVLLFAFANQPEGAVDYLRHLDQEREAVERLWTGRNEWKAGRIEILAAATPQALIERLARSQDTPCVFHFGGHAETDVLGMEAGPDGATEAYAQGLVPLLAGLRTLKLVVLNGCTTHDQAKKLHEAGILAVVGTSREISDAAARDFTLQFYSNLLADQTVTDAFDKACHAVATLVGEGVSRNHRPQYPVSPQTAASPWIIEPKGGANTWRLSEATGEASRKRWTRRAVITSLTAAVLVAPLAWWAWRQADRIAAARLMASAARSLPEGDNITAVTLALAACGISPERSHLETLHLRICRDNSAEKLMYQSVHQAGASDLAWLDDRRVLSGGPQGLVVTTLSDGQPPASVSVTGPFQEKLVALAVQPGEGQSRFIAVSGAKRSLWIGTIDGEWKEILPATAEGEFTSLAWSPDGNRLCAAAQSRSSLIYDMRTGSVREFGGNRSMFCAAWTGDGKAVLLAGKDDLQPASPGLVELRDAETLEVHSILRRRFTVAVAAVSPSSSGIVVCAAGENMEAFIWKPSHADAQILPLRDAAKDLNKLGQTFWGLAWHPRRPILATGGLEGVLRLFDAGTGRCLVMLDVANKSTTPRPFYQRIAWSPDGRRLAATSMGGDTLWVWNMAPSQWLQIAQGMQLTAPDRAKWSEVFGTTLSYRQLDIPCSLPDW